MLADLQLKSNICIRNCQTSYYIFGIFQTKSVRPTSHVRASDWTVGLPTLLSTSTSCKKKTLNYHYIMIYIGWLSTAFLLSSKTLSFFEVSFVLLLPPPKILIFCFICQCAPSPSRYLYILSESFWEYLVHFRNNQFYVLLSALQWQCILSINYSNTNGTAAIIQ